MDVYISTFIVWTDKQDLFDGRSRDERLLALYRKYMQWCDANRVSAYAFLILRYSTLQATLGSPSNKSRGVSWDIVAKEFPMAAGPGLSCLPAKLLSRRNLPIHMWGKSVSMGRLQGWCSILCWLLRNRSVKITMKFRSTGANQGLVFWQATSQTVSSLNG